MSLKQANFTVCHTDIDSYSTRGHRLYASLLFCLCLATIAGCGLRRQPRHPTPLAIIVRNNSGVNLTEFTLAAK